MMKILVAGATGNQGGAVIDHLLTGEFGTFEVYGLTRDATTDKAASLRERGVTVVEGDMTDREAMTALCADVAVVFGVTTFFEAGTDVETEQGITLVDAAVEAGVDHFVYSSVASANRDTGLAHFDSKYAVEQHLEASGLDYTIVRPTYFMQNFAYMHGEQLASGELVLPLAEGTSLQMVDATDIGEAVGVVLGDRERFVGETIELAGDDLTLEEIAARFSDARDHEVEPVRIDIAAYRDVAGEEMASMFVWFNDVGYDVDFDALETWGIDCNDLEAFLAETDLFRSAPAASR